MVLLGSAMFVSSVQAGVIVPLKWDPSPDTVAGYKVKCRVTGQTTLTTRDVGNVTAVNFETPTADRSFEFFVTAYDSSGTESDPSNLLTYLVSIASSSNAVPSLAVVSDQSVALGGLVSFAAIATDPDAPGQSLTFSLGAGAPVGAAIQPLTGLFTWQPTSAQASTTNSITITVTDNGSPALSASRTFKVIVGPLIPVNTAPVLAALADRNVIAGATLSFTASATDLDIPAQTLSYTLGAGAPAGASIQASSGAFSWTPTTSQAPSTNRINVVVTDNGSPALSATRAFTVIVVPTNTTPSLAAIANQTIVQGDTLSFTAAASDVDLPAQTLSFSLGGTPPTGASINVTSGQFTWTPAATQAPSTNSIQIVVTDNGSPVKTASRTFSVVVKKPNTTPVLTAISNKIVTVGDPVAFAATASDADVPSQTLTFSLGNGAPSGATIQSASGQFSWQPPTAGTNVISIIVRDNGSPSLSATQTFAIVARPPNTPPTLAAIGNKSVTQGEIISFTATATDTDLPAQTLVFGLADGAPPGASINPSTGSFSWMPSTNQAPSTNLISVIVTDNGSPSLSATQSFTVTVSQPIAQSPMFKLTFGFYKYGSASVSPRGDRSNGSDFYPVGTVVKLTAKPQKGAQFISWNVNGSSKAGNPLYLTMNADMNVSPIFSRDSSTAASEIIEPTLALESSETGTTLIIGAGTDDWIVEATSDFITWNPVSTGSFSDRVEIGLTQEREFFRIR